MSQKVKRFQQGSQGGWGWRQDHWVWCLEGFGDTFDSNFIEEVEAKAGA